MKKILIVLLSLFLLTSCSKKIPIGDYMPYEKIPIGYSLENAKADGCVVYENGSITSGQAVWNEFVSNTKKGLSCTVRLAFYYTLENQNISPEHYEEIKNDYPALYIQDLGYNKKTYTLYSVENEEEYIYNYKHLVCLEDTSPPDSAVYYDAVYYYLVNDPHITYEQIRKGIFSSFSGDFIDCKRVYSKLNYK